MTVDARPLVVGRCPSCGAALETRDDGYAWCDSCGVGATLRTDGDRVILRLSDGRVGAAPASGGLFVIIEDA